MIHFIGITCLTIYLMCIIQNAISMFIDYMFKLPTIYPSMPIDDDYENPFQYDNFDQ